MSVSILCDNLLDFVLTGIFYRGLHTGKSCKPDYNMHSLYYEFTAVYFDLE